MSTEFYTSSCWEGPAQNDQSVSKRLLGCPTTSGKFVLIIQALVPCVLLLSQDLALIVGRRWSKDFPPKAVRNPRNSCVPSKLAWIRLIVYFCSTFHQDKFSLWGSYFHSAKHNVLAPPGIEVGLKILLPLDSFVPSLVWSVREAMTLLQPSL